MSKQVITTTVFGPLAETLEKTFASFSKVPNAELHAFIYNDALPKRQHPQIKYHLVKTDPTFLSIRRDALFRRWTLPDTLDAEYALVVDGTDAICIQSLPPFTELLKGGSVAAATEWVPPMRILGQGFTSTYINAGVTFWHLPSSLKIREEVAVRGRAHYRGPFDDQTALNEVVHTRYFDKLTLLPSQYNWRALYHKNFRSWHHHWQNWPRVDSLDGVVIYHNQHCVDNVLESLAKSTPAPRATLEPLTEDDKQSMSRWTLLKRRIMHRLRHS
jgi:hypothetical protein